MLELTRSEDPTRLGPPFRLSVSTFAQTPATETRTPRQPIAISVDPSDDVLREAIWEDLCKRLISENSLPMSQTPAHSPKVSSIQSGNRSSYSTKDCAL